MILTETDLFQFCIKNINNNLSWKDTLLKAHELRNRVMEFYYTTIWKLTTTQFKKKM